LDWRAAITDQRNKSYCKSNGGFGPATADIFRRMVGLPEVKWDEKKQSTLSDFGSLASN
jgi:hypothetical protein